MRAPLRFARWGWIAALCVARVALAHSITDEVSGGGTQATATGPASYYVSNRLNGAFTLGRLGKLTLRPGFVYTHAFSAEAPTGANFSTSDANIYFVSLGLDAELGKHWELGFEANGSPPSSSAADTTVTYTGAKQATQTADAQLDSTIASAGGIAFASYDTAGDDVRRVDGLFELGVAPTEYFLQNQIEAVWNKKTMMAVPTATLLADCTGKKCPNLTAVLQGQDDRLFQARLWASATATIRGRTDVGLDGAYYVYDKDPTTVGYSSLTGAGRSSSSESGFGNGLPIAPLRYTLRASLATRFANMMISASFLFGQYVSDGDYSYDLSIGLRLQYKLSRHVKIWLKGTAQRDVDATSVAVWGGAGAIGMRATF